MIASRKAVALQMSYWHYAVAVAIFLATPTFAASSNDLFANAILLNGWNVTTSASLSAATRETGEPFHSVEFTDTRSVWWSWTAPANATVLLSAGQSDFPGASLAVYTGNTVSTL